MKHRAGDFKLFFVSPCTWFGVSRPSLTELLQYLNPCQAGVTWHTGGLDSEDFGFFLGVSTCDLRVFGFNFVKLPKCLNICKTGIAQHWDDFDIGARCPLMRNVDSETLDCFQFWLFELSFSKLF